MNKGLKALLALVILSLVLQLAVIGFLAWKRFGPQNQSHPSEVHLGRAGIYSANGLWRSAAEEYQKAAELESGENAANLWVKAGDLCYEQLNDYNCAAQSFLNAKVLDKEFSRDSDPATRLVDSLKRLGKTQSANALLNELTALAPESQAGSTVAARIGERQITLAELRGALEAEPEAVRKSFSGADGLRKYLDQYIFTEFLYSAALDENLFDDRTAAAFARMKERYLAELYFRKKFLDAVQPTDKELRDYYNANPSEFKDASGKALSFDQAKARVEQKLKENKSAQLRDDWLKEQAQKRGLFVNAPAFGPE